MTPNINTRGNYQSTNKLIDAYERMKINNPGLTDS